MTTNYEEILEQSPKHPYGEYGDPDKFMNRVEQIKFFVTSGSSGYMRNGKYYDISGADIGEDEMRVTVTGAGMLDSLNPSLAGGPWEDEE